MRVCALTSSQSPHETLDLFLGREAAEAELREILEVISDGVIDKRADERLGSARLPDQRLSRGVRTRYPPTQLACDVFLLLVVGGTRTSSATNFGLVMCFIV